VRIPTTESDGGIVDRIGAAPRRSKRVFRSGALGAGGRGASAPARRMVSLALFVALLAFALAPASAQALLVHTFSFGASGTAGGDFNSPQGVAIYQSTGDVYVVDALNFRVEKFTPNPSTKSGNFDLAFGENVNTGGGNICTTSATCQAGTQGTTAGAFESPMFIAVDNSASSSKGDVYVGDPGDNTISKFDSSGNLITSFGTGGQLSGTATTTFSSMDGITVDNSGNLLLIDNNNTVWEFSPTGSSITSFPTSRGMSPTGLDINAGGNIFKVNGDSSVEEYTSTGTQIGTINEGTSTTEINIDRSTGDLYQDTGGSVNHYHFDSSGNVVNSGGPCPVVEGGSCAPTDTFGSGVLSAGTGVGFDASETSAYVGDAGAEDVVVFGPPSPGPPEIDGESATNILSTKATLTAQIIPFGNDTTCTFQYVDDTDFTNNGGFSAPQTQTVPCSPADLGSGFNDVTASADISGLTINTTYDFRVIATNSAGTVNGNAAQFTTKGAAQIDSLSSSNISAISAELDAQINPLGTDTTCVFKIVDDTDFTNNGGFGAPQTQTLNCSPADLGAGTTDVSASAQATNLSPNTTYDFEVITHNSLGDVTSGTAQLTTLPPLRIDSESVINVTDTTATLKAQINPSGVDTHAQFQYVDDATFQASGFTNATTVPQNPIDLGSGITDVTASVDITGLTPGTKYHFRVLGSNAVGSLQGAPHVFTTLTSIPAAGLPDNRAYEMVSPVNKTDGEVTFLTILGGDQAAPDGNTVGYVALAPFPGGAAPSINDLATRTATGWTSQPIMPQQAPGVTLELPGYGLYSADLSKAILSNGGATVGGTDGQDDPALVRGTCTTALFPTPPPLPTTPCTGEPTGFQNLFVRDNSNASFQLVNSLAQAPSGETPSAANEQGASADLSTVVFDEGAALTASAPMGQDSLYAWHNGTVSLLGTGARLGGSGRVLHAVSNDGSRIFFTDSNGNLNVFENGSATQVDMTQGGSGPGGGGQFMTATNDGSVVYFLDGDAAGLTSDTVSGSGNNLYAYNVNGGTLTDLTGGQNPAQVDGVLGTSSDGSYVYFVAEGVLASGATPGQENLYVDHNGTTTFIATLSGSDGSDWNSQLTSRVTPDGTHLAFDSVQSLTGFDNTDANTGSPDTEIFLYNASTSNLVCASCNPTGQLPVGSSQLDPVEGGLLNGGNQYLQHNLSDDGSRLFFDSSDVLSPHDTNGRQDVYEYENGHDYLISTGQSTDTRGSLFLDASANGNDAFFITRDQLVPQDGDNYFDLYDARVNGGFPVSATAPCSGNDNCKPAPTPAPLPPTVASVSFSGPGNGTPGAPTAKVAMSAKKALKGFRFSVLVTVPGKGKITISGAGLKTVRKSVQTDGTYMLTVGLTKAERNSLKRHHKRKLKITVHVTYSPAGGSSSAVTFSVTMKA
jgi:hypothetical protein